jgi:hypothetical protein
MIKMEVKIVGAVPYNNKLNLTSEVVLNPKEIFELNYYDEIDSNIFNSFFADLTENFVKEFNESIKRDYTKNDVVLILAVPDEEEYFYGKDNIYDKICDLVSMPE